MKDTSRIETEDRMQANNRPMLKWKRISKSIAASLPLGQKGRAPAIVERLQKLSEHCGSYSLGRKRLRAIAAALDNPTGKIAVPVCLDHRDFIDPRKLPAIVAKHTAFIERIMKVTGPREVLLLIPVHEYEQECGAASTLVETVQAAVSAYGWSAQPMLKVFPDIQWHERRWVETLMLNERSRERLQDLARARAGVYSIRAPGASPDTIASLTVRTSSQYLAFGEAVQERNWMVVNHTTPNLAWYAVVNAALLHNPVYLY